MIDGNLSRSLKWRGAISISSKTLMICYWLLPCLIIRIISGYFLASR